MGCKACSLSRTSYPHLHPQQMWASGSCVGSLGWITRRKSVTYPETGFSTGLGYFLIKSVHITVYKAPGGRQTPYPQKRQQTLGATSQESAPCCGKPAKAAGYRGFGGARRVKAGIWLFFDQNPVRREVYGPQPIANILSTEAPTDFGGKSSSEGATDVSFSTEKSPKKRGVSLVIFRTTGYRARFVWCAESRKHLIHRSANRDCG